jgi:hypothetical protein
MRAFACHGPHVPAESRETIHYGSKSDTRRRRGQGRGALLREAAKVASRQDQVLGLKDLREIGLSDSGVRHWVAVGHLHRKHAGVYAFGRPDLSFRGKCRAALLACGPGAVLSFGTAGDLHAIRKLGSIRIDVTVHADAPLRKHTGIKCHRAELAPQDIIDLDGFPVTSVARTLLDLATVVTVQALERAAKQAVIERVFDMREIEDLLRRSRGHRGIRKLRHVLERGDLSAGNVPASGLEVRFATLCAEAGLPRPEINRWVLLGDEYHKVDFYWRRERIVIETDSNRYHSDGWQRARDARRDELLKRFGFPFARVHEDLIEATPEQAVAVARRLLGLP